ncbi:MAG: hypothetical protein AAF799_10045 [Myxococcota bacterium]
MNSSARRASGVLAGVLLAAGCPTDAPVPGSSDTEAGSTTGTVAPGTSTVPGSSGESPGDSGSSNGPIGDSSSGDEGSSSQEGGTDAADRCGDGMVTGNEECDGDNWNGQDCTAFGFVGGELVCNRLCNFEFDLCVTFECGDGLVERTELCDGTNVGGQDCTSLGFDNGTLECLADCSGFDTSGCGVCGDGSVDPAEICDSGDIGGETCVTQGFTAGSLGCGADCTTFDTSACTSCGNGSIEGSEDCDGASLGGQICGDLGFDAGVLACSGACDYDTSGCFDNTNCCFENGTPGCEDLAVESCVCAFDPYCCNTDWDDICVGEAINDCGAQCSLCGNGIIEDAEVCDGTDFGGESCISQGFDNGALTCAADCGSINTGGCGNCGDGTADPSEACDGADLDGQSCVSFGFSGGSLACTADCGFDTSGCVSIPSYSGDIQPVWDAECGCHVATSPVFSNVPVANAYAALVNVPSGQVALDFVEPGNANNSYIIHKMENTQAVGDSMPLGGPLLPAGTVNMIREWIDGGAPNN